MPLLVCHPAILAMITFDLFINIFGAIGCGMGASLQFRNNPKSKKWVLAAVVSIAFLGLAIGNLFGFEL